MVHGKRRDQHILIVLACQIALIPQLWQGATLFLLNSVHWSLFLEALANIAHGLGNRRITERRLLAIVLLGWNAIVVTSWMCGNLSVGYARNNALGGVARLLFGYPCGVLIQRLYSTGRLPSIRLGGGAAIALPFALLVPGLLPGIWFADAALVTLMPLAMIIALSNPFPSAARPAAEFLGDLSYPLYAIHLPLLTMGSRRSRQPD